MAATMTHRKVDRSRPRSLVAQASDHVATMVLTTDTSAHRTTRSTPFQWSRNRTATGSLATAWASSTCSNSGVSGSVRRTQ